MSATERGVAVERLRRRYYVSRYGKWNSKVVLATRHTKPGYEHTQGGCSLVPDLEEHGPPNPLQNLSPRHPTRKRRLPNRSCMSKCDLGRGPSVATRSLTRQSLGRPRLTPIPVPQPSTTKERSTIYYRSWPVSTA